MHLGIPYNTFANPPRESAVLSAKIRENRHTLQHFCESASQNMHTLQHLCQSASQKCHTVHTDSRKSEYLTALVRVHIAKLQYCVHKVAKTCIPYSTLAMRSAQNAGESALGIDPDRQVRRFVKSKCSECRQERSRYQFRSTCMSFCKVEVLRMQARVLSGAILIDRCGVS